MFPIKFEISAVFKRISPLAPILRQFNLVYTFTSYDSKLQFNIIHPSTSPKLPLPFRFSKQNFIYISCSTIHVTCPSISLFLIKPHQQYQVLNTNFNHLTFFSEVKIFSLKIHSSTIKLFKLD